MKSMTGFGEGEAKSEIGRCAVQMQSVNSRYFKLNIGLPRELAALEPKVRNFLQKKIGRGQLGVHISFIPPGGSMERVTVDRRACKELAVQLNGIRRWLNIKGPLDMSTLVNTGAILKREMVRVSERPVWTLVRKALAHAREELLGSQENEGRLIYHDFVKRWRKVDSLSWRIEALRPRAVRRCEERIHEKVRTILGGANYDERRLLAEVSIYADRVDITEEMVRFRSHLKNFRRLLQGKGEIGKKLDFTIQEILREVNTITNKANDAAISRIAIDIKAELEKIREQIQNIQ